MPRCAICNYTHTEGSDLLDTAPNRRNRVRWNDKYGEFLCFECIEQINDSLYFGYGGFNEEVDDDFYNESANDDDNQK